jgi:hypothetical protein
LLRCSLTALNTEKKWAGAFEAPARQRCSGKVR